MLRKATFCCVEPAHINAGPLLGCGNMVSARRLLPYLRLKLARRLVDTVHLVLLTCVVYYYDIVIHGNPAGFPHVIWAYGVSTRL